MTIDEKVARLEGAYEHLATRADIAELKGKMRVLIATKTTLLAILNILLRFIGD